MHGRESHVGRLKKALYRLMQPRHSWYFSIDGYLLRLGFTKSEAISNFYYVLVDGELLILVLYADVIFLMR